ncbi:MAG: M20/M25/M40 family metallo-hydrolase, partial [Streptosporangiaceae bacterium]
TGEREPLMLLGHADVVGASSAGWIHPPFGGVIDDGRVWGRGSLDMKGQVAASLMILQILRSRGVRLNRDVILAVTADEESGSRLGAHWLWEHHRELVTADIAFNEGGGQRFETPGGPLYTVQVAEKGSARLRLTATGDGGHASVPRTESAIFHLAQALVRLQAHQAATHMPDVSRRMLSVMRDRHSGKAADAIGDFLASPTLVKAAELPIDPLLRDFVIAGTHNTAVPTILRGGDRINVCPRSASVEVDGRVLPAQAPSAWAAEIQAAVAPFADVELVQGRASAPGHEDADTLAVLSTVMNGLEAGATVLPYINSASTDARAFPGTRVFGFFPSASNVDYMRLIHGTNENALVSDLTFGMQALLGAVLRLAS